MWADAIYLVQEFSFFFYIEEEEEEEVISHIQSCSEQCNLQA